MDVVQRTQAERVELDHPAGTRLLGIRSARGTAIYVAIAVVLLFALGWASIATAQTW